MNCIECGKELTLDRKKFCSYECSEKWWNKKKKASGQKSRYDIEYNNRVKKEALYHYGGNTPKCVVCGYSNIEALEIDHMNNDGQSHRKENNYASGRQTYIWLRQNNFPEGFQILCANCHKIKHKKRLYKR